MPFLMIFATVFFILGNTVLALACMIWWRRLRHWAFAVLALAFLLFALIGITDTVMHNQHPFDPPEASQSSRPGPSMQRWLSVQVLLNVIGAALLTAGGLGFLSAARDPFLFWEETGSRPSNSSQPQPPTSQT